MKPAGRPRPLASGGTRHAGRAQAQQLALDVVDAEADVVQPVAVLIEPRRQRVGGIERLHQLEPCVAEIEVGQPHRNLRRVVHGGHLADPAGHGSARSAASVSLTATAT